MLKLSFCWFVFLLLGLAAGGAQTQTDVDAKDSMGKTALVRASETGDTASVIALIRGGANVNVESQLGWTPLQAATQGNHLETILALIHAGANLNAQDARHGMTALIRSVLGGQTAIVEAMIKAGADVNTADRTGQTALTYAAYLGHSKIVHALITAGAKLNQADKSGNSVLAHAAWACHADIVRDLMKAGAAIGPQEWIRKGPPRFEDFPMHNFYKGPAAPVDFHSKPDARTYRTRLREGAKHKPNFAGRYVVVDWGCGSSCQSYTLIDSATGKIFDGTGAERGADFRLNSSLFIADPDSSGGMAYPDDPVSRLPVRYLLWKDGKFHLIYEEACSVEDHHEKCGCEDVRQLLFESPMTH